MSQTIYKILRDAEWCDAESNPGYMGSADDQRDGFIHFSTLHQLTGTLEKYYRGLLGTHIIAFEAADFGADQLKWEPSRGGALFPHLYGALDVKKLKHHWRLDVPATDAIDISFLKEA